MRLSTAEPPVFGRHRRWTLLVAIATAVAVASSAGASTDVPPPTVDVTMQVPVANQQVSYPVTVAEWSVADPGHDATLTAHIACAGPETDVVGIWTSAPLDVTEIGPVVFLETARTYGQADPAADGDGLVVRARFSRGENAPWGAWRTITTTQLGMGLARGAPVGQGNATFTIPYTDQVPVRALRVQVSITESVFRVGALDTTFHVHT